MAQHNNLFAHTDDRSEAYAALRRDFKRDHRTISIADVVTIIAVLYLCRNMSGLDYVAMVVLAGAVLTRLNSFIDNSNRNWFMHMLDWDNQREQERREAERGY